MTRAGHAEYLETHLAVCVALAAPAESSGYGFVAQVVRSGHTRCENCLGLWTARSDRAGHCLGICRMGE